MSFDHSASQDLSVGGCYRSGTTLLEKLLHQHPNLSVASQPFPDLYFHCKAAFDQETGLSRRYPLSHLFLEDGYEGSEFHRFLDTYRLETSDVESVLDSMGANTLGLWTPEILNVRDKVQGGSFLDIYRQLNRLTASIFGKAQSRYVGGKEVLCEEYLPYLLSHGVKAILIVRDPRDMIASLDFRERDNKTGANRPVLYSLRLWRKSVAMCLALETHDGFHWLRYEDLVQDPKRELNRITSFLAIQPFDSTATSGNLHQQDGSLWKGNSSFNDHCGVSPSTVGRFARSLPPPVVDFVEACCRPEMVTLGYRPTTVEFCESAITSYRDPFPSIHPKFRRDYSHSEERPQREIERYRLLRGTSELSLAEQGRWFIFPRAYECLRRACV